MYEKFSYNDFYDPKHPSQCNYCLIAGSVFYNFNEANAFCEENDLTKQDVLTGDDHLDTAKQIAWNSLAALQRTEEAIHRMMKSKQKQIDAIAALRDQEAKKPRSFHLATYQENLSRAVSEYQGMYQVLHRIYEKIEDMEQIIRLPKRNPAK